MSPRKDREREQNMEDLLHGFGREECPRCGWDRLTILDEICDNCGIHVNRVTIIGASEKVMGGMKLSEIVARSKKWWNTSGRDYFRRNLADNPRFTLLEDEEIGNKSGVFNGKPFDALTRREKFRVVRCWYNAFHQEQIAPANGSGFVAPKGGLSDE